jgi:hypothetical protein
MSYYLNPMNAVQRLREEWELHGGLIVAVDFDSTIHPYKSCERYEDSEHVRKLVRDLYDAGCTIIIWTASEPERWDEVKEILAKYEIKYHHFNENSDKVKFSQRKVYANAFLDDRAGLHETYNALNTLLLERKVNNTNSLFKGLGQQMRRP